MENKQLLEQSARLGYPLLEMLGKASTLIRLWQMWSKAKSTDFMRDFL